MTRALSLSLGRAKAGPEGRKHKPGSYLPSIVAADLIANDDYLDKLHADLIRMGFTLTKAVRPYLSKRSKVTVRLVWRKRDAANLTSTYTQTMSVSLSDILSGR